MNFFTVILSIYILALNLTPCVDYVASNDATKTEISKAMTNKHQHQDSDLCSPFCICQCCHINALYPQFIDLKFEIRYISIQKFYYLNGAEKDVATSILQPPKI